MDKITTPIERLLAHPGKERLTVRDCMECFGESSIPLALVLFTLLSSLPLFGIPGFTVITGVPIMFLGGQLLLGKKTLWVPMRVQTHHLKSAKLWKALERSLPLLQTMEKILRARLPFLSSPRMHPVLGVAFIIMGTLLALPIPLINFPAGFSMFILAVGLAERDGVLILIGLALIGALLMAMGFATSVLGHAWAAWAG